MHRIVFSDNIKFRTMWTNITNPQKVTKSTHLLLTICYYKRMQTNNMNFSLKLPHFELIRNRAFISGWLICYNLVQFCKRISLQFLTRQFLSGGDALYKTRLCKYSRFQLTSNQTEELFFGTPNRILKINCLRGVWPWLNEKQCFIHARRCSMSKFQCFIKLVSHRTIFSDDLPRYDVATKRSVIMWHVIANDVLRILKRGNTLRVFDLSSKTCNDVAWIVVLSQSSQ